MLSKAAAERQTLQNRPGNFGALFSLNNICEELYRQGTKITKATVSRHIKALLDAKILYECPRFDIKSKKALSGEKKYYLSDLGFYFADNTDNRINFGPVLENIVFLYARSLDYSVSVGRLTKPCRLPSAKISFSVTGRKQFREEPWDGPFSLTDMLKIPDWLKGAAPNLL